MHLQRCWDEEVCVCFWACLGPRSFWGSLLLSMFWPLLWSPGPSHFPASQPPSSCSSNSPFLSQCLGTCSSSHLDCLHPLLCLTSSCGKPFLTPPVLSPVGTAAHQSQDFSHCVIRAWEGAPFCWGSSLGVGTLAPLPLISHSPQDLAHSQGECLWSE